MLQSRAARPVAGEGLLHPLAVLAVLVLALNDHWGKAHFPGLVTGKLSDFAGLVFFPLVLQALWEAVQVAMRRPWRPSLKVLVAAALLTAGCFALVKTWPPASHVYRWTFGALRWPLDALLSLLSGSALPALGRVKLTQDVSDLVALPMVLVPLLLARQHAAPAKATTAAEARQTSPRSELRPQAATVPTVGRRPR